MPINAVAPARKASGLRLGSNCARVSPAKLSVSLRGPVTPTSRISRVAAPCPATGGARESARTGGIFVLDGHRSANCAGFRDVSSELHEVRMRHNPVRNIDSEVVNRIACASLRHEGEVPGTIVGRSRMCGIRQGNKNARFHCDKRELLHADFSKLSKRNWVHLGNGEAIVPLKEDVSSRRIKVARGRRAAPLPSSHVAMAELVHGRVGLACSRSCLICRCTHTVHSPVSN